MLGSPLTVALREVGPTKENRVVYAADLKIAHSVERVRAFMPINRSVAAVNISESQIAGDLDKIEARIAA